MDIETKLSMSLDDLAKSNPSRKSAGRASKGRQQRRSSAAPYGRPGKGRGKGRGRGGSKGRGKGSGRGGGGRGSTGFSGSANKRVYVGNLAWDVSWQDLKDHMRSVGEVEFCDVFTEGGQSGGRSKGCGVVQYQTVGAANRAYNELHDSELNGRLIFVREDREGGGGGKGGGGGLGGGGGGGGSGCSVYVGNLSWDVSWQDLKDHMRQAGEVVHADVMTMSDGKSKGCGIVTYSSAHEAQDAIDTLTDSDLNGRNIFVREDREESGGGGGGGGSSGGRGGKGGGSFGGGGGEASVYVGNIAWDTTWWQLKDAFADYDVQHVDTGEERDGKTRGFAILKFPNKGAARRAINDMNETELNGRNIMVREDRDA